MCSNNGYASLTADRVFPDLVHTPLKVTPGDIR
jgi:hypothetical protein